MPPGGDKCRYDIAVPEENKRMLSDSDCAELQMAGKNISRERKEGPEKTGP
jgi:hypothetical protein